MSACAVAPLPRKIPFCAVGLSYFERLLSLNRHSEITVFGLIVVKTIGEPGRPMWAEISDDEFARASNVSEEQYRDALNTLIRFAYIKEPRRNAETGRMEYAVVDIFRSESAAKTVHGRCPHCSTNLTLDHTFIPIPHIVLRKMGACLDPAAYACLMVILRYTLRWDKDLGVYATPQELNINDFQRHTEYSAASITKALGRLGDEDLIQRKDRPGKPSIYCPVLENFYRLERRDARQIHQVSNRERVNQAKGPIEISHETPKTPIETPVVESPFTPYAFCVKCDRIVSMDDVSDVAPPKERKESPPRHGPQREKLYESEVLAPGKAWGGFKN